MLAEDTGYSKLADPVLLEKIDKLFACNVGDHIALPQLVVVGDQSSGKSSVLEGLTKLPFPRHSGLCTRFATQITFQRSAKKSIAVSIVPYKNASPEHTQRVKEWSRTNLQTLDAKSFSEIMKEVHEVMGLSDQQHQLTSSKRTFSNDVLRLEICGPDEDHLSAIDVPGIFKNTTEGVTTTQDIDMVREMVHGYMQNPRSVMLTVVPANVDIATQEIVEMAKELDPDGERTLGVLTKPDLVDKGAEKGVVDLINGKKSNSNVQWSVVRNPGQKDLQDQKTSRELEASFFRDAEPWNSLDKDRVGIEALRVRLQEVITSHARREFPKVKLEISKRLKARKESLKSLGAERDTPEKQASYILDIVTNFQTIASLALKTDYGGDDLFDEHPELRLATELKSRNDIFSEQMQKWGQEYWFGSEEVEPEEPGTDDVCSSQSDPLPSPPSEDEPFPGVVSRTPACSDHLWVRITPNNPELEDILYGQEYLPEPSKSIMKWLEDTYRSSRGFELGTFNSSLLSTIMKRQSKKWEGVSLGYISDAVATVHRFILRLLQSLCADERVRTNLLSILMDDLVGKYKKALDQVSFLLFVERGGTPMTENHYFSDNLEKSRQERTRAAMESKTFDGCSHGQVVRLNDIMQHHPMSNMKHVVQDIHDILKSYYKVARKRFVDNVCMQAADYHLVVGPNTPLKLFSPAYVHGLTIDQLEDIAGEDANLKRKRKQLKREIDELETGRKILL